MRTLLARPRTRQNWHSTMVRMVDRAKLVSPMTEDEQWAVTAYMVAISPDLQRSAAKQREVEGQEAAAGEAALSLAEVGEENGDYDADQARTLVETQCSLCHPFALVGATPPASGEAAREPVQRMFKNGMMARWPSCSTSCATFPTPTVNRTCLPEDHSITVAARRRSGRETVPRQEWSGLPAREC